MSAYVRVWQKFPQTPNSDWVVPEPEGGFTREAAWAWQPRHWWYDRCRQLHQAAQLALRKIDATNGTIQLAHSYDWLDELPVGNDAEVLLEPYHWGTPKFTLLATAQTLLHQARLAIALERHWLAHGAYPEKLEALVPAYLENVFPDVITDRPMGYERGTNELYTLSSVGPDGVFRQPNVHYSDDWLWAYPTNPAPRTVTPP